MELFTQILNAIFLGTTVTTPVLYFLIKNHKDSKPIAQLSLAIWLEILSLHIMGVIFLPIEGGVKILAGLFITIGAIKALMDSIDSFKKNTNEEN